MTGVRRAARRGFAALLGLALLAPPSDAAAQAAAAPTARRSALGDLGSRREPIKIDADRLDVFDREGRATFTGNVVAVQGDATMKCTTMDVLYEGGRMGSVAGAATGPSAKAAGPNAAPASASTPGVPGGDAIKRIECRGPVTITSKTQVATGDRAEFDRARNKVVILGNATLSDGPNVTRGERVAYDLNTGIANVEGGGSGGRVRALIVPGSGKDGAPGPLARPR